MIEDWLQYLDRKGIWIFTWYNMFSFLKNTSKDFMVSNIWESFIVHGIFRKSQYIPTFQNPWEFCSKEVKTLSLILTQKFPDILAN